MEGRAPFWKGAGSAWIAYAARHGRLAGRRSKLSPVAFVEPPLAQPNPAAGCPTQTFRSTALIE